MQEVIVEIRVIEAHYAKARYPEAYQALRDLCTNNTHCQEFSSDAAGILSRYSDLENNIINGLLDLAQQELKKNHIRQSYDLLLRRIKVQFQDTPPSCYEEQAMRMKEQRDMLRKSLMIVEDDLCECDNPKKSDLLRQIKEQIEQLIAYFKNIIKDFRAVKNYE